MTKKVLILNDDPMLRVSFRLTLKKHGIGVLEAATVKDALDIVSEGGVSVALVDINLGAGTPDGYSFLRELRSLGHVIPVYMVSGFGKKEEELKALELGAKGYLQLPVSTEVIMGILEKIYE